MQTTDFSPGHFFGFVLPGYFRRELSLCVSVPACAKNYILETKKQFLFETRLRSSLTGFFFYNIVLGMHALRGKKNREFRRPSVKCWPAARKCNGAHEKCSRPSARQCFATSFHGTNAAATTRQADHQVTPFLRNDLGLLVAAPLGTVVRRRPLVWSFGSCHFRRRGDALPRLFVALRLLLAPFLLLLLRLVVLGRVLHVALGFVRLAAARPALRPHVRWQGHGHWHARVACPASL